MHRSRPRREEPETVIGCRCSSRWRPFGFCSPAATGSRTTPDDPSRGTPVPFGASDRTRHAQAATQASPSAAHRRPDPTARRRSARAATRSSRAGALHGEARPPSSGEPAPSPHPSHLLPRRAVTASKGRRAARVATASEQGGPRRRRAEPRNRPSAEPATLGQISRKRRS